MRELTGKEIERQDFVDNLVFEIIRELNPAKIEIEWDIEMIADVRNEIKIWLVNKLELCNEQEFYPYIEI